MSLSNFFDSENIGGIPCHCRTFSLPRYTKCYCIISCIRKRGAVVEWQIVVQQVVGSRPACCICFSNFPALSNQFDTCQKCRKSSIFIVKFATGMWKNLFDTCVFWSCVTRCGVELLRQLFLQCSILSILCSASSPAILCGYNYLYSPANAWPSPDSHRVLCEAVSPYCFVVGENPSIAQNPSSSVIKVQIIRRREGMVIYKSFNTLCS